MNAMTRSFLGVLLIAAAAHAGAAEDLQQTWDKGAKALLGLQKADGSWGFGPAEAPGDVAATSLAVAGLAGNPAGRKACQAQIDKAVEYILKNQGKNGEIHNEGQTPLLTNYKTSLAVMALVEADPVKYKPQIDRAAAWLQSFQYQEKGALQADPNDPNYGGAGYDEKKNQPRGDLSNTHFMLEALDAARVPKDSAVWARAVKFVERCQNRSESNDGPGFDKLGVVVGDDGGFFYRPGESKAEKATLPNGKETFRSYGSMTYAGYKSLIHAGLTKDDPRVKAAKGWIAKNYTLDENPGMGAKGLFYYYHAFAAAMAAAGEAELVDADGQKHLWANELVAKLKGIQKEDGSWSGDARWMEDIPPLPTMYSLVVLNKASKFVK